MIKLSCLLSLAGTLQLYAQHIEPLRIGDPLPDIMLRNIVNSEHPEVHLSKLKGKAILLDFGNTSCGPCLEALPKLSGLKQKYGADLEIYMISTQSTQSAQTFLLKNQNIRGLNIPIVTQDTLLRKYFRVLSIPHEVWIDKNGIIQAFTDHHSVTEANIENLIHGRKMNLPVKWDFQYRHQQPLITLNAGNIDPESYPEQFRYSVIGSHMSGLTSRSYETSDSIKGITKILTTNREIAFLYFMYSGRYYHTFRRNQIVLDVSHPEKILNDLPIEHKAEWEEKNTYCLEMTFPIALSKEERNQRILTQLKWYFNIDMIFEKKRIPCWIIYRKPGRISERPTEKSLGLTALISNLNNIPGHIPVRNETAVQGEKPLDLNLAIEKSSYNSLELMQQQLAPYGLGIRIEDRQVEICTFRERRQ